MSSSIISYPSLAKRVLYQINLIGRNFCQQRPPSHFIIHRRQPPGDIESLRAASAATFAKHDFRDVRWVGVFGSFARGTQKTESDVDIVVYRKSSDEPSPPDRLHLEDVLPRVWNRSVDIVYIEDFEFRGYVPVESLLCSQTIYGSARDEELRQLRRKASDTLTSGQKYFSKILKMIKEAQSTVEGVSEEACTLYNLYDLYQDLKKS